ncbi:hypothetical protein KEG38_38980 [Polyangium jinanense]|uniref:hypothetical protein n=1 Tax=Polyangium jinanense TaxID=2829994 RepID=UPI002342770C|nr:hypothetical protein [Polyangium jinanense]MDC3959903.1 hypothetical protein [Polyangium jinanense]
MRIYALTTIFAAMIASAAPSAAQETPAPATASAPARAPAPASARAPDFDGTAAPPTAAGTTGLKVTPGLEMFAQYAVRWTATEPGQRSWFHLFEVPRVHGAITGEFGPAMGRVVLEGVRSASEGALIGVAGDSIVLRLREAWAGVKYSSWFVFAAGVVPTLTVPELEGTWRLRVVGPAPIEQTGMLSPADLGATARVNLPRKYGFVAVGAYNGEGYTNRELNRGKNIEIAASVHPAPGGAARPLAIFGSYVVGSSGTGLSRADRLTGSVLWQGTRVRAGASVTHAWGLADDGARRSLLVDGFVRIEPVDRLMFGLRGAYWDRDLGGVGDTVATLTGSVGYRVAQPLEGHVAVTRQAPGDVARAALPGSDFWELRLASRVVF